MNKLTVVQAMTYVGLLLTIPLLACGSITLCSGMVVDKEHEPAWTEMRVEYDPFLEIPTLRSHHHPAEWGLWIEEEGEQRYWSVSEAMYGTVEIGDYWEHPRCASWRATEAARE